MDTGSVVWLSGPAAIVVIFLFIAIFSNVFRSDSSREATNYRLQRLERKVDRLLAEAGIEWSDDTPDETEIRNLVRQGQYIEAIKAYREHNNAGLKDARLAVDVMRQEEGLL